MKMEQAKQIQIKTKDEDLAGAYSNLMQISHTKEEFILDFFFVSPPQGSLIKRIVMSPSHVKRMIKALEDNIGKYETRFSKIEEVEAPEAPLGFAQQ